MKPRLILLVVAVVALVAAILLPNALGPKTPFEDPYVNPVDDPALPRVLLIGDSISIDYTTRVRKLLDGVANVHRVNTNCLWSAHGLEQIDQWVGDSSWDVIHFNFGLWDWYGWRQEEKATPDSYAANLEGIVRKLRARTEATLIFANTTPPCIGEEENAKIVVTEERAGEFNEAARVVMEEHGVEINDLYDVIGTDREKYQIGPGDVHYNQAGRDRLAAQVAAKIGRSLAQAGVSRQPAVETR